MAVDAFPALSAPAAKSRGTGAGKKAGQRRPAAPAAVPAPAASVRWQIKHLTDMGFAPDLARDALAECVWDVNRALDLLISRMGVASPEDSQPVSEDATAVTDPEPQIEAVKTSDCCQEEDAADKSSHISDEEQLKGSRVGVETETTEAVSSASGSPRSSSGSTFCPSSESSPQTASWEEPTEIEVSSHAAASVEVLPEVAPVIESQASADDSTALADASSVTCEGEPSEAPEVPIARAVDSEAASSTEALPESTIVSPSTAAPKKEIACISVTWAGAEDGSQLAVAEGSFVRLWRGTESGNGWIYAELVADATCAGWLPVSVIQALPTKERWMLVVDFTDVVHDTQIDVAVGNVVKVRLDTRTGEDGWVHVDVASAVNAGTKAGWLPVFCLEWTEE